MAIVVVAAIVFMTRDGTPPAQKMAAAPAAPPAAKPAPTPAEPGGTSFDIVKIDPTGHAVIAGRAAPGAKVHLSDGDKPLGDVTADFRGEWVLVPDRPLPPGQHKIGLEATDPKTGARQTASDTVALVVAPPASPNASVAVLLPAKGDRPAQVLQQPGGAPAAGALSIDTAEADDKGNLAVAGHGAPGAAVTIYGGDQKLGTATADPSGKWALAAPLPEQGKGFDLRAEIPGANGAQAQRVTEPYAPPTEAMAVPAGDSYTVKPGNNLWFLARNSYGAGTRYTMIYQANRGHIRDPDLIYPGQVFLIPKPQ
ncbi:MAG TPA: LysM peptidoglycan-binding domain-containing protein [Stellaceae bacterium]|nr:LysM peptidoglycan-binding domain-containing protein [Stellaceae bacterium]